MSRRSSTADADHRGMAMTTEPGNGMITGMESDFGGKY